jgi:hypothetical protein
MSFSSVGNTAGVPLLRKILYESKSRPWWEMRIYESGDFLTNGCGVGIRRLITTINQGNYRRDISL